MSPAEQAQMMTLIRQAAGMSPELRAQLAQMAVDDQRVVLQLPYWSVIEFSATPDTGVITIDTKRRAAFQYAQGQDMGGAGAAGKLATYSDTNLQRQGETLSNADVYIYGVCVEPLPGSEPLILEALWDDGFLDLSTDGQNSVRIGTPAQFPAAGGLYGAAQSADVLPDVQTSGIVTDGGPGASKSYLSNGNPMAGNFKRFPSPFKWGGVGQGGSDAALSIGMTLTRPRVITLPTARTAGAAGIAPGGYTQPSAAGDYGTWARLRISLITQSFNRRSQNA
jgi:hypothetical protein